MKIAYEPVVYEQCEFNETLWMQGIQALHELIIESEMLHAREVKNKNVVGVNS
jgi:hypothetical protein